MANCERDGLRSSSAASESHIAVVVAVVVEPFLTVFLGLAALAVEEIEQVKGLELDLTAVLSTV